ncbi:ATP-dependent helicase [Nakamurella antarctica]|uniref:DNA 3'-5' helicase n=1 Tax=Nakamurella antarctica TaxID=1902245 RepID=A0A3G8ZWL9_9ACTN|nr:ATP-dependent helicase [Nakamurella antarctica]AZI58406.1 ATP-dependent helicase [Nakamurella antarctica]
MISDPLVGLDDEQRSAVLAPSGPLCVLAGAGTGKTRTITHRIAQLVQSGAHPAGEVLAVTFTTRAAGEMRVRLRDLGVPGVQARTFHAAALRQLRYFWPKVTGEQVRPVIEQKLRLVAVASRRVGTGTDVATLRDLASEIEWAKATLLTPGTYVSGVAKVKRDTPLDAAVIAAAFDAYEQAKDASGQLDFDDILLNMCGALDADEAVAREFRSRYRCFVVDEYQDVTPLQQRVLDTWLGGRDQLTVVGDANQTIYSFAGASPKYLLNFDRKYPHAAIVRLERDYRSTPQVVTLANRVIAGATGPSAKLRLRLRPVLPDGPEPVYSEHPDEATEARTVAQRCQAMIAAGMSAASIAVLYRINAQSEVFEQALATAGVPYLVRGGERFFARAEVRQAMMALRQAAESVAAGSDTAGLDAAGLDAAGSVSAGLASSGQVAAVDSALSGTDRSAGAGTSIGTARVSPARILVAGAPSTLVPLTQRVLQTVGLTDTAPAPGALRDRWDALVALVGVAEGLADADPQAGLGELVAELNQRAEAQHAPTVEGVTLASLHAAKGLEWEAVFLVGLTDGTMPIQHAETPEEVEEERRLFYVGVTRAKQQLFLSWGCPDPRVAEKRDGAVGF